MQIWSASDLRAAERKARASFSLATKRVARKREHRAPDRASHRVRRVGRCRRAGASPRSLRARHEAEGRGGRLPELLLRILASAPSASGGSAEVSFSLPRDSIVTCRTSIGWGGSMNESSRGPALASPILPRLLMQDQRIVSRAVVDSSSTSASVAARAADRAQGVDGLLHDQRILLGRERRGRAARPPARASRRPARRARRAGRRGRGRGRAAAASRRRRRSRPVLSAPATALRTAGAASAAERDHGRLGLGERDAAEEADRVDAERVARRRGSGGSTAGNGGLAAVLGERGQLAERRADDLGQIGVERLFEDARARRRAWRRGARGGA